MILETKRLFLRPWEENDANDLFELAKNPLVGPVAGWPPHTSIKNSREIIKTVLSANETYAVVLKSIGKPIGSIGIMIGKNSNLDIQENEGEIGYWIGVPYWGQGLIPEAVDKLVCYGFDNLKLKAIWCGYFDGNEQSRRVQEKCGFTYQYTKKDIPWPIMNDIRTEHVTRLTKDEWKENCKVH